MWIAELENEVSALSKIIELPEEIEQIRDRKWRREEILKIETAAQVEALVEDLGFVCHDVNAVRVCRRNKQQNRVI